MNSSIENDFISLDGQCEMEADECVPLTATALLSERVGGLGAN